ncbi:uncharacterized protein A1O9_09127 [Exophiala aquamarina CBS 119918]|uniref:Cytochrome P450 oxidoreductase n=1 Tax=Exophiala aquamarina CBS 119918 TaxID=1182545 RepID=A0A072PGL5_9EURO|nr:uncharacterized protein A1O9_09127 [Exophiala aquamarina CBS 119918]KEF54685.1 hypothetical protein A1O9_09127 [Exophiala aquamarina CBS 119918]
MAFQIPTPFLLLLSAALQNIAIANIAPEQPLLRSRGSFAGFALLNFLLFALYRVFIYPNFTSPLRHLPTPKGAHPIFGHVASQFSIPRGGDYLRFTKEIHNDGLIRLKGFLNADQVLLTSTKALAEVLVSKSYEFTKPERSRNYLRQNIGDGLVVAEGDPHKRQRKHSLPSFGFRQIKGLYPLFWEKAVKMTRKIEEYSFDQSQATGIADLDYWAPKAALDIIGVAGLGRDFNTLENSGDRIVHLYEELTRISPESTRHAMLFIILGETAASLLMPYTSKRLRDTTRELRCLSEEFVRRKRDQIKNPDSKSVDTLALLMKGDVFSDQELVDQLLTIIAAGNPARSVNNVDSHETTSSAFTWLTYLLTLHPDIQARLRAEIHEALPLDWSENPTADLAARLECLPLLNGVCNEALRVYPTVPLTSRVSKVDNTVLGQHIRAGTRLFIVPWAVNNDPAIWGADVAEFKPERWIDRKTGSPNQHGGADTNYAVLTFLHGPRSCIGQGFAKAELRCLVAAFVGAFEFEMADKTEEVVPAGIITTKPRNGLKLRLRKARNLDD